MERQLEVAAWNWEQDYHGPDTPTSPNDLTELRHVLEALVREREHVEVAVAREVQLVRDGAR
jgi:hypothetical protein